MGLVKGTEGHKIVPVPTKVAMNNATRKLANGTRGPFVRRERLLQATGSFESVRCAFR